MSMKMVLVGAQLKHFKGAVQFLAKSGTGTELLVEAIPEKLILRTINTAKSAYASVTFNSTFFDAYDVYDATVIQAGIQMKQMLSVFRTQRITRLACELNTADNRFSATLSTENGLQKVYRIPCMDSEILQAAVDKEAFPTCVIAGAAELNRLLGSFQTTLEEITIIATPDTAAGTGQAGKAVHIQSFYDPAKGKADKSLYTQLAVDTHEVFFSYTHGSDEASDVTFNLKDFKHMLALCEAMGANVAIRFDAPGLPLVVEPHFRGVSLQDVDYEAELVLATLMESQSDTFSALAEPAGQLPPPTAATEMRAQSRFQQGQAGSPGVPGDTPWRGPGAGGMVTPQTRTGHAYTNGYPTGPGPTRFAAQQPAGDELYNAGDGAGDMHTDAPVGSRRLADEDGYRRDQGQAQDHMYQGQEEAAPHPGPGSQLRGPGYAATAAMHQGHRPSGQLGFSPRQPFAGHDDAGPIGPTSQPTELAATTDAGRAHSHAHTTAAGAHAQPPISQQQPNANIPGTISDSEEEKEGPAAANPRAQHAGLDAGARPMQLDTAQAGDQPSLRHPSLNPLQSARTQFGSHATQGHPLRSRYLASAAMPHESEEDDEEALPETPPG